MQALNKSAYIPAITLIPTECEACAKRHHLDFHTIIMHGV